MNQCIVDKCERKYYGKGYCSYHWTIQWRKEHPLYGLWAQMKQRCNNPNHPRYVDWGARGIKVCARWLKYQNFIDDMLPSYKKGLTLERINNNGNYEPSNCRWASYSEQGFNQRLRKDNTTGYSGIGWYKPRQKWRVRYSHKFIGYFDTKEEAITARKMAGNIF